VGGLASTKKGIGTPYGSLITNRQSRYPPGMRAPVSDYAVRASVSKSWALINHLLAGGSATGGTGRFG